MADTPSAPAAPSPPVEVSAQLTAAKQVSGSALRETAQRLQAAGAQLPAADRQLLTAINTSLGRGNTGGLTAAEMMQGGGIQPADARNAALANRLLAAGADPERVLEAAGDPAEWYDARSPAQVEHDRRHGMVPVIDPGSYFAPVPGAGRELSAPDRALDTDARAFASGLGLGPDAGSNFIRTVYSAADELARSADRGALRQKWDGQLASVFPGDKLAEAEQQVDQLLKRFAADAPLVKRLREHGLLKNPTIFAALRNRALRVNAWLRDRPE